jgi:hypothetical protein
LNNTVGRFEESPSVEARMRSFDDSIHKMLWPELREKDSYAPVQDRIPGVIDRVGDRLPSGHREEQRVYLKVSKAYLPDVLQNLSPLRAIAPSLVSDDGIRIGPIPPDTPIGLLSNLNLLPDDEDPAARVAHDAKLARVILKLLQRLHSLGPDATNDQARAAFKDVVDDLLDLSKCPDLVVNRGHLFGATLPDADKAALIEFLKTF